MLLPPEGSESGPRRWRSRTGDSPRRRALAGRYAEIVGRRRSDRHEIPGYRDVSPELINDLRAGAKATVEVLARTAREGSTVRPRGRCVLRELAARRVHQGGQPRGVHPRLRVALLAYWDAWRRRSLAP